MIVFLDFEASSLAKNSYPIEVGWVFEDGLTKSYLIKPAPGWTDWDEEAQRIHGIARAQLFEQGVAHDVVAQEMVESLAGHDLCASAPSWDGKWLSALLRAGGHNRHMLRLRGTDAVMRETALAILGNAASSEIVANEVELILAGVSRTPFARAAHRALADAEAERARWLKTRALAVESAVRLRARALPPFGTE